MCGGDLAITDLEKVVECEYCGTTQTVPTADNEKKMTLFNRANRLRMSSEFDKAAVIYESIIAEFPEETEAYWGAVLCKYGIEYVDDPATGKKIPTCHRASFERVSKDENYELAMEYADVVAQRVYRREAMEIDRLNEEILSVSRNEKPYDIFICYKETDDYGGRTPDSVMAQDIYDALNARGHKVFFSRISLEDKLGQQYEPYIFAALNSAKIMLAVGTKYEHFHAVWVKNEWGRFLRLAARDKSKALIPCYRDMDPYDMPDEFSGLQAQDLAKLGAIQDLVRGVEKLLRADAPARIAAAESVTAGPAATTESLLKRAFMFLMDGEWESANEYAEKVLDIDPENAEAYLAKAMAQLQVRELSDLSGTKGFEENANTAKALHYGSDSLKSEINGYIEAFRKAEEERIAANKRAEEDFRKVKYRIAAGRDHTVGLRSDGTVLTTGNNFYFQCHTKSWRDITAIATGVDHTVGLRLDGTVLSVGRNSDGRCDTISWGDVVAIAAGHKHTVGLCSDGTVLTVGNNSFHQRDTQSWRGIVAIAAGWDHTVGLRSDGTVLAIGDNSCHQCNTESWRDVVSIAAGYRHTVCLHRDGTVSAIGYNSHNQCDTESWEDVVAIAAGHRYTVGLRSDGTVLTVGNNDFYQRNTESWREVVAIAAGSKHTLGLRSDGTVLAVGYKPLGACETGSWKLFENYQTIEEEYKAALIHEKASLEEELPTLNGMLKARRRREDEARLAEIEEILKEI